MTVDDALAHIDDALGGEQATYPGRKPSTWVPVKREALQAIVAFNRPLGVIEAERKREETTAP